MKSLLRIFFFMQLGVINLNSISAQKNTITLEHSTIVSKLLFKEAILDHFDRNGGWFNTKVKSKPLELPIITSTVAYSYERNVSRKIKIGIKGRRLTRGLQSRTLYQGDDIVDGNLNLGITYRLTSYELALISSFDILTKKNLKLGLRYTFAYDTHIILNLKNKTFQRFTGNSTSNGSFKNHYNSGRTYNLIKNIGFNHKNKTYRFGNYMSFYMISKTILKNLHLVSSVTIGGSTQLRTKDQRILDFLPDGQIVLASLDFGLSYSF